MTKHECAVIMAFTGVAMLKGNDIDIFYEYVAKILGRPVYTHEMAMLSEEIKEAARNDFVQLCRSASAKTKTNADRIRQMTDEQIADILCFADCETGKVKCPENIQHCSGNCCGHFLRWLKQEVSEDAEPD